ncbi:065R [Invertebrate iridescent virus 6]|uniref:Uncharacterized protein 065R n=1 Tax=Invertebrate iridescent virus 6 TaxID=176652 RepID=065R_IIV6|nr:065R [Invertebrate iridescent virus 6]Q91G40.1 RecName: Full=Uncharacterized protein 065R [Invertebrate iridescent virus 6]AAK81992.1 065R [Invertebrate iridescent virus 6]
MNIPKTCFQIHNKIQVQNYLIRINLNIFLIYHFSPIYCPYLFLFTVFFNSLINLI